MYKWTQRGIALWMLSTLLTSVQRKSWLSPILAGISGFFWTFSLHTSHFLSKWMRYWGARWTKTFKWEVPPPLTTFLPCLVPQASMRLACFQIEEMAAMLASEFYSSLSCFFTYFILINQFVRLVRRDLSLIIHFSSDNLNFRCTL